MHACESLPRAHHLRVRTQHFELTMSIEVQTPTRTWRCPLCQFFAAPGPKGVLRHIGSVHAHECNFHITCGVQGCPRSYSNYHSYKKHWYKKHRDVLELDDDDEREPPQPIATDSYQFSDSDTDTAPQYLQTEQDERRRNALFLMKATTVCKVSKCSLDQLIGDITLFLDEKVQSLKKEVMATLRQKDVELDEDLSPLFQSPSVISPFQGLHTEHMRKKFYVDKMGLLVSSTEHGI